MGYPYRVTFKVKRVIIKIRIFSHQKRNSYTYVITSDIYIYVESYLVITDALCFIIFHTKIEYVCRRKFIKNRKREN